MRRINDVQELVRLLRYWRQQALICDVMCDSAEADKWRAMCFGALVFALHGLISAHSAAVLRDWTRKREA